ncbi:SWR1 complex bromodomain subunit bdf1-like [Ostrinia furnacalis]|uniref:SWR1 complex bromodomain subunit bdf1-like n=1 Tax=Ostrinia furnacalis TaxID=93504 RepID=UPI0010403685|nr:SWR1 complex bromodomain subunit bdf1-like [Ostrinia furnacalis]
MEVTTTRGCPQGGVLSPLLWTLAVDTLQYKMADLNIDTQGYADDLVVIVPDYLEVIEQPMDFSTIKAKLAGGEYARDGDVIADVALVFANCYTYNQDTHPVAKAGARLEKYINKRCSELELPALPESLQEDEDDVPLKRRASSPSAPAAKRARHK